MCWPAGQSCFSPHQFCCLWTCLTCDVNINDFVLLQIFLFLWLMTWSTDCIMAGHCYFATKAKSWIIFHMSDVSWPVSPCHPKCSAAGPLMRSLKFRSFGFCCFYWHHSEHIFSHPILLKFNDFVLLSCLSFSTSFFPEPSLIAHSCVPLRCFHSLVHNSLSS